MARFIKRAKCSDSQAINELSELRKQITKWDEKSTQLNTEIFGYYSITGEPETFMQLEVRYGPTNNPHEINGCEDFTFQKEWLEARGFKMVGQHGNWDVKKESE